jgi:D-serine deaminase-like pyridoxal phosphate-dependent protein
MNKGAIPYAKLDTPVILINLDRLETNIKEMTNLAISAGVTLRPHTKVHQSAEIAKMQIKAGAFGIEVGNVLQAEAMAAEGIEDIVIAHPFVGVHKFEKLKRLLIEKRCQITVVVDMIEQAELLSMVGRQVGRKISVNLKIDTGINRYGVLPGEPAIKMAKRLCQLPGIKLSGIYAHESGAKPTEEGVSKVAFDVASAMCDVANMFKKEGIQLDTVSVGASPTFRATCRYLKEGKFPEITEIHPGQCVIGDLLYMNALGNMRESCALTVLTTVMSSSHPDHAVIDAGYKTLGADSMIGYRETPGFFWKGYPSFGSMKDRSDLWVGRLGAETAWVFYMDPVKKLRLADRLEMIPNNATLVINLHDKVYGVRRGRVERTIKITGRGSGS